MASATGAGRTANVRSRQAPLPPAGVTVVATASHHRQSTPTAPYSRRAASRSPANGITQKHSIEASRFGVVSPTTSAGPARSLPRRSSRVGAEVPWTIPSVPSPEAPQARVMQSPWPTVSPTSNPTGRRAEPRLTRAPSLKNARDRIYPQAVPFSPVAGEHFRDNDLSAYGGYGESAARTVAGAPTSPHQLIQSIQAAADLRDRGHLSIDEFTVLKQSVLAPVSPVSPERTTGGGGGVGVASAAQIPAPTAADFAAAVVAEVSTPLQTRLQNPAFGPGNTRLRQSRDPRPGAESSRLMHSSAHLGGGGGPVASTPAPDKLMAANPAAVDVSQIGRSTPESAAGPLAQPVGQLGNRTAARLTAVHARPGQFDIALPMSGRSLGFSVSWEDGRATIDSIKPGTMLDRPAMAFPGDFVVSVHGSPITNAKMVMPLFAKCVESGQLYMRIERRGHGEDPVAHTLVFCVRFSRSRQHLGLVLQAVKDAQTTQGRLVVARIDPLGAAGRDGRLAAGDWIRQVNGVTLCADDHAQVQRLLSSAELELEVLRGAVPVA